MPESTPYLYLGITVVLAALGLYILSLILRLRNSRQAADTLRHLREK